jgi:hypothetical protein
VLLLYVVHQVLSHTKIRQTKGNDFSAKELSPTAVEQIFLLIVFQKFPDKLSLFLSKAGWEKSRQLIYSLQENGRINVPTFHF